LKINKIIIDLFVILGEVHHDINSLDGSFFAHAYAGSLMSEQFLGE